MAFAEDIPPFTCLLRAEYLYDLESHHGEFVPVMVFAVDSVEGYAIGFDCLTDFGAMFSRMPISSLVWKEDAPNLALDWLELWDCFSYSVEAYEYGALRGMRCEVALKDRKLYPGTYMFTLSWLRSAHADQPGEIGFKRAHFIRLDNGCFCAQPNNRIRWRDSSFVTSKFPAEPMFKTNTHQWKVEQGDKWVTDSSDRHFYEIKTRENE